MNWKTLHARDVAPDEVWDDPLNPSLDIAVPDWAEQRSVVAAGVRDETACERHEGDVSGLRGRFVGPYQLLELIGEGAMGHVFRAVHVALGRQVAIKVLRSELAKSADSQDRFFAEARAANLIRSEHLVAITDLARDPERATYLVMELLEGEDLQRLLTAGPIDVRRSLRLVRQLCTVVAEVHAVGLVHRDLKPENIFVTRRGGDDFLKLLDFGIAKRFDVEVPGRHNTAPGLLVGTPEYMSPEQALGGRVDWRTDVHALGVILFELLTRRRPYAHQSLGLLLHEIAFSAPPQLRDHARLPRCIVAPLEALVTRCLDKDPSARPQSAEEVGAAVDALLRELEDSATHRSLTPGPGAGTGPAAMQGASPEDAAHTPESELAVSWAGARHSLSLRRARSLAWLMAAGLAAAAAAVASVGWLGGESAHPAIAQGLHPAPALTSWGIHGPAKTGTGQLGARPNPTLPLGKQAPEVIVPFRAEAPDAEPVRSDPSEETSAAHAQERRGRHEGAAAARVSARRDRRATREAADRSRESDAPRTRGDAAGGELPRLDNRDAVLNPFAARGTP